MIAAIKGIIIDKTTKIILETLSGLYYEIHILETAVLSLPDIGQSVTLYTSMIVREQEIFLVGFQHQEEKNLFEILITSKGIGPKQAMKILDESSTKDLRLSIVSGDISSLSKIKGISVKKAEQLVLDLQEKMKKMVGKCSDTKKHVDSPYDCTKTEVLLTMRALGYTDTEIKRPLDIFFESRDITAHSTESLVSEFLTQLSLYS